MDSRSSDSHFAMSLTLHSNTLCLQINSIRGACCWPSKNDHSELFLENTQDTKPRSLGPCSGGAWLSQKQCHQQRTRTIGTWWGAEQRGWQQALSSGKYMWALGAGFWVHVPLRSLRNCTLTESGRYWDDFLQAEIVVIPKGTKLCPSKRILSCLCGAGRHWGMVLRGPWAGWCCRRGSGDRTHGEQSQTGSWV